MQTLYYGQTVHLLYLLPLWMKSVISKTTLGLTSIFEKLSQAVFSFLVVIHFINVGSELAWLNVFKRTYSFSIIGYNGATTCLNQNQITRLSGIFSPPGIFLTLVWRFWTPLAHRQPPNKNGSMDATYSPLYYRIHWHLAGWTARKNYVMLI